MNDGGAQSVKEMRQLRRLLQSPPAAARATNQAALLVSDATRSGGGLRCNRVPSASCSFALKSADGKKKKKTESEKRAADRWRLAPFSRQLASIALLSSPSLRCSTPPSPETAAAPQPSIVSDANVSRWRVDPAHLLQRPSADQSGLSDYSQLHQRCNRSPGPLIHPLVLICLMPVDSRVTGPSDGVHLGPIADIGLTRQHVTFACCLRRHVNRMCQ